MTPLVDETEKNRLIEIKVREVFPYLDAGRRKRDRKFDTVDLEFVLKKIKAPRDWILHAKDILWEIDDNNLGYLTVDDLVGTVQRIMKGPSRRWISQSSRILDVIDFVSKDPTLTGKISPRDCIVLLHDRFGGSVDETRLRELFMTPEFQKSTSEHITFKEFCKQVKVRRMLMQK